MTTSASSRRRSSSGASRTTAEPGGRTSDALNAPDRARRLGVIGGVLLRRKPGAGQAQHGRRWDPVGRCRGSRTTTARPASWVEGYYDDVQSLAVKWDMVNQRGLAGTGMWALLMDEGSPDLWNLLAAKFVNVPPTFTETYNPPRTLFFEPGTYVGRQFNASGAVTASLSYTLATASNAPTSQRSTIPNQPGTWYYITAGIWAGYWIQESAGVTLGAPPPATYVPLDPVPTARHPGRQRPRRAVRGQHPAHLPGRRPGRRAGQRGGGHRQPGGHQPERRRLRPTSARPRSAARPARP